MEMRSCRCCLSPGIHKDLNSTYMWLNNREVYSEMLKECFDIALTTSNNASTAICEECIKLLRHSCNFKRQVLHNELELLKTLSGVKDNDRKSLEVKFDQPLGNGGDSDYYYLSDGDHTSMDMLEPSLDYGDNSFLSDAEEPEEMKPAKPSKHQLDDPNTCLDLESLRKLVSAVIEHSTIMPFRWRSNKYMCFYCCYPFSSSRDLRQHTTTEHENPKLKCVLKNVRNTSKIKLDISNATCKKCGLTLDNLTEFFDHLIARHNMKLKKEFSVQISTFKLSDDGMFCHDCGQKFLFFGTLISHVNKLHSKTKMFLCEICAQGFAGKADVIKHVQAVHNTGNKKICKECDKCYSSEIALIDHMRRMHREERLKCPKCSVVLRSPYMKKRHMALVHDVKQFKFSCDICNKTFMFMSKLARHKAMTHFKEKNLTCEICGFKVYNKELLRKHMVRHDDARPLQCGICEKTFQRKKSLDFHIRIHMNDKRYACKECGKAFVQLNSLKLHRKTHHNILKAD